ncbi:MAG: viral A-type inclusion protein [Flavitalea sp.]
MKKIVSIIFIASMAVACGGEDKHEGHQNGYTHDLKTKTDSLEKEVMDGHDVGMAKMNKLNGAIKDVKAAIDSIRQNKKADTSVLSVYRSLAADLNQADYSMNRWMEEYSLDSAKNDEKARIAYLESERDKVAIIKDRILNSIQKADSLLGKK